MKIPQNRKRYCKHCKKHTMHKVSIVKKGQPSSLTRGSKIRMARRGAGEVGFGNKGKLSRGAITSWKRSGAKSSKKVFLKLKCNVCSKMQTMVLKRSKKAEIK